MILLNGYPISMYLKRTLPWGTQNPFPEADLSNEQHLNTAVRRFAGRVAFGFMTGVN